MTSAPPVSIIRIGPSGPSATLVKTALLSFLPSEEDDILVLSNKYFTARVQLVSLETEVVEGKQDGVILVFDGLVSNPDMPSTTVSSNSFDSLNTIQVQNTDLLLQICVGVALEELSPQEWRGTNHQDEYSKRILWCLDRQYEYIEADMSQEGQQKGHDDRDKDGFARIVEAIQGTVWSSAVMEKKKETNGQSTEEQAEKPTSSSFVNPKHVDDDNNENPYVPPDPLQMLSSNMTSDGATKDDKAVITESVHDDYIDKDPEKEEERSRHKAEEQKLDEFEGLMRKASSLREEAKNGNLPDDVRRQRAADFVLGLMDHLGMDDDESSGAEDSSVDEE